MGIVIAALLVGGTGLFIGLFLGVAGVKFAVEVDEKEVAVREVLPGNNCGGCGYAGCEAWLRQLPKVRPQWVPVLWAENRWHRRLPPLWARK